MKIIIAALMFLSTNAFSGVKSIKLSALYEIKVVCPAGNTLSVINNVAACRCPYPYDSRLEGKIAKCEESCTISVETKTRTYGNSYDAMILKKNESEIFSQEVSSKFSDEVKYRLPDMYERAKKAGCYKTRFYDPNERSWSY